MKGVKNDQGKLRYDLLPPTALEQIVAVLTHGAEKYGPENWRFIEDKEGRYFAASQRHVWDWRKGVKFDEETNLHALAHAACSLLFLIETELHYAANIESQKGRSRGTEPSGAGVFIDWSADYQHSSRCND